MCAVSLLRAEFDGPNDPPKLNVVQLPQLNILCPPGFQAEHNLTDSTCSPCTGGTYAPTSGSACIECLGFVNDERTTCQACPEGGEPTREGTRCACKEGFYDHPTASGGATLDCRPCPLNSICSPGTTKATMSPGPGYWLNTAGDQPLVLKCRVRRNREKPGRLFDFFVVIFVDVLPQKKKPQHPCPSPLFLSSRTTPAAPRIAPLLCALVAGSVPWDTRVHYVASASRDTPKPQATPA